jgi:magnesium transporter
MLLPTFIVCLYGMNFDTMPELHWPIGYGFAALLIVTVTTFQVWYFRKKRSL